MKNKKECKFDKKTPKNAYRYTMCGLDYVYLVSGYEIIDEPDFGKSVVIHNADALHVEIARNIVQHRESLSAQEIRFIRGLLDLTQKELASELGVDTRTFQRWESLVKSEYVKIPYAAESLIRIMFWDKFISTNEKTTEILKRIKNQREHYKALHFKETKEEWFLFDKVA